MFNWEPHKQQTPFPVFMCSRQEERFWWADTIPVPVGQLPAWREERAACFQCLFVENSFWSRSLPEDVCQDGRTPLWKRKEEEDSQCDVSWGTPLSGERADWAFPATPSQGGCPLPLPMPEADYLTDRQEPQAEDRLPIGWSFPPPCSPGGLLVALMGNSPPREG